jgi:hypothetical protein
MTTYTRLPKALKASWGIGPWCGEPDEARWIDNATGLHCLALRHLLHGHWSGYVAVTPSHPFHRLDAFDCRVAQLEVHWHINYAAPSTEGEPEHLWWFGFDCGHWNDQRPGQIAELRRMGVNLDYQVYRTLVYVQAQCTCLAEQLSIEAAGATHG